MKSKELTERAGEMTLQQREELFSSLVDSIKDYTIFLLDPEGRIITWNKSAELIKGYKAEEIKGRHISFFYTEEDLQKNKPELYLETAREKGKCEYEGWRIRKNGQLFWANVLITALYDDQEQLTGYTEITRDNSKKRASEERNSYLARLLEDTSDAIFSTNLFYEIRSWNPAAEELYGHKASETIGKGMVEVVQLQMDPAEHAILAGELGKIGYLKHEFIHLKRDGTPLTVQVSISVTKNAKGEADGFVFVCRDYTERKRMEAQLHEFNEELGQKVRQKTNEVLHILERITDGFMALDKNFCCTYINKKMAGFIDREPESLIGKLVWDEYPRMIGTPTYKAALKAMQEQTYVVSIDHNPKIGFWHENHMYPSPDGLSIFIRDISGIKQAEMELVKSLDEVKRLASYLQDVREEEKKNIAREMHDELGQMLTGLKMDVVWLRKKIDSKDENIRDRFERTLELLNNTKQTIRRITTDLHPPVLKDLGLVAAIEEQSRDFENRSGIKVHFVSGIEPGVERDFSPAMIIGIYRIFQESLTNIAKHAQAKNVNAFLEVSDNRIIFRISDDGKGFNVEEAAGKKTLGLVGIRERALMMNGEYSISSTPGQGTTIVLSVPLT